MPDIDSTHAPSWCLLHPSNPWSVPGSKLIAFKCTWCRPCLQAPLLLSEISETNVCMYCMAWIRSYTYINLWDAVTHPCLNSTSSMQWRFVKPFRFSAKSDLKRAPAATWPYDAIRSWAYKVDFVSDIHRTTSLDNHYDFEKILHSLTFQVSITLPTVLMEIIWPARFEQYGFHGLVIRFNVYPSTANNAGGFVFITWHHLCATTYHPS